MAKINIRSPYFINVYDSQVNLESAKLDLYVYTGTQITNRGAIKYTLNADSYDNRVTFEISELVRDYLDITFDGNYDSQMVWVDYQVTEYQQGDVTDVNDMVLLEGYDGYGYFEDGANPQNDNKILISNDVIYKLDDAPLRIPVNQDSSYDVIFSYEGDLTHSESITASTASTTKVKYVTDTTGDIDSYKERVLKTGIYEGSQCLTSFLNEVIVYPVDRVYVDGEVIDVINVSECKQTPYKLTFVNKFGILQDMWFFKRSNLSLSTKKETYKSNILNSGSYSINSHQTKVLNKQGTEKLVLNSGFVDEQYNEVFRQLMLSEKVWIEMDTQVLPINISSSSLNYKTSLNDKMINYTIEVDFAFDKINSVR